MERAGVYYENKTISNRYLWTGTSKEEQKLLEEECNRLGLEIVNIDPWGSEIGKAFINQLNNEEPENNDDPTPTK